MKQIINMSANRCLVISCSKAKSKSHYLIPAIERYDGPLFRVLKKYLAASKDNKLSIFILSAKYGLISANDKIPFYDCFISSEQVNKLRPKVLDLFEQACLKTFFEEIFFVTSRKYQILVEGIDKRIDKRTKLTYSTGGNGLKAVQLKKWLYMGNNFAAKNSKSIKTKNSNIRGEAILCGKRFRFTSQEVITIANKALDSKVGNPWNFRNWYVEIGEIKVSPKWLVSQLTYIPPSSFTSCQARRVLKQFGIEAFPYY